jgi:DNA-binding CsgD family transcriptional regulator
MSSWLALREAIHELDSEDQAWVRSVHAEARPIFDEGLGAFVYSYRVGPDARIRLDACAGAETAPEFWQALFSWGARNERTLAGIYRTGLGSLASAARAAGDAGSTLSNARTEFEAHAVADVFTVSGHDAQGSGVFLTIPRAKPCVAPPAKQLRALERLAADCALAARLRNRRRRIGLARLSAAEARVARLVTQGASDKCIAAELGVSLSTVSTLTTRLREKLSCRPGEEILALSACEGSMTPARRLALLDRLTLVEYEVVSELLVGRSYAAIAAQRGVSVRTVESQCSAVFRKCGVSGKRALASALLTE